MKSADFFCSRLILLTYRNFLYVSRISLLQKDRSNERMSDKSHRSLWSVRSYNLHTKWLGQSRCQNAASGIHGRQWRQSLPGAPGMGAPRADGNVFFKFCLIIKPTLPENQVFFTAFSLVRGCQSAPAWGRGAGPRRKSPPNQDP